MLLDFALHDVVHFLLELVVGHFFEVDVQSVDEFAVFGELDLTGVPSLLDCLKELFYELLVVSGQAGPYFVTTYLFALESDVANLGFFHCICCGQG